MNQPRRAFVFVLAVLACLVCGQTTEARGRAPIRLDITAKPLSANLSELGRKAGVEILVSSQLVEGRMAPALKGPFTIDEALTRLLAGAPLTFTRSPDGVYVITRASPNAPPPEEEPVALPELLVVGRKSQNADIERTRNDIQPYQVWSARDIAYSHAATIDEFLRGRVTANQEVRPTVQDALNSGGSTRSEVDLRGLGTSQTLVLIDGRRMPHMPSNNVVLVQPDLNGVPPSAIERIETLSSTAGGIFGAGATAGAINLVLKHDYRGGEVLASSGVDGDGSAPWSRVDGRLGFTPDGGRTEVMLAFSHYESGQMRNHQRDYLERSRALRQARDPDAYSSEFIAADAINIVSLEGPLSFDPALGGRALESQVTSLPLDHQPATDLAQLLSHAGTIETRPSDDDAGARATLLTRAIVSSALFDVRRRIGDHVEVYLDALGWRNTGLSTPTSARGGFYVLGDAPTNPFAQAVFVTFPLPGLERSRSNRSSVGRATAGLIADLPAGWKANLDYSIGLSQVEITSAGDDLPSTFYTSLAFGVAQGGPAVSPFTDWSTFRRAIDAYRVTSSLHLKQTDRLQDGTLRLGGPLAILPGGELTLSLQAEHHREVVPATAIQTVDYTGAAAQYAALPSTTQTVSSLYGELRAPLVDQDHGPLFLRGLEAQLAVRYDATRVTLPANLVQDELGGATLTNRQNAMVYTAGFRVFPFPGVMLRSSLASGFLPPTLEQLATTTRIYTLDQGDITPSVGGLVGVSPIYNYFDPATAPADPKRGGRLLGSESAFKLVTGGGQDLGAERARSLSAGVVLIPPDLPSLRVSIDYTRIRKSREIVNTHARDTGYFIANEDRFPGRVVRAPLTDQDRVLGFTAGVIVKVDTTAQSVGKSYVDVVDLQADYHLGLGERGDLRVFGSATWQPRLERVLDTGASAINFAGHALGPLKWRAQAGVEWSRDAMTLNLNGQFLDHYLVYQPYDDAASIAAKVNQEGRRSIPRQVVLNLAAHYRIQHRLAGSSQAELRLGIQNLLDCRPSIVTNPQLSGYSPYGDPRGRRFDLALVATF